MKIWFFYVQTYCKLPSKQPPSQLLTLRSRNFTLRRILTLKKMLSLPLRKLRSSLTRTGLSVPSIYLLAECGSVNPQCKCKYHFDFLFHPLEKMFIDKFGLRVPCSLNPLLPFRTPWHKKHLFICESH